MDSQRVALQIVSFPFIALILRGEHGESSFLGTTVTKPLVSILVFNCPFSQSSEHTSSNTLDFPTVYI